MVGISTKKKGGKQESKKKAEARREEERRKKAEAEEKARKEAALKALLETPEGQNLDFMKWLESVPLSRKCYKRIDREFSDGVLLAEVIAHYCPDLVDLRHYFPWVSSHNKLSNWELLNRKVLPELGFELDYFTIQNCIRPYPCKKHDNTCSKEPLIYKVLEKVRECIAEINPELYEYRKDIDNWQDGKTKCVEPKKEFKRQPRVDIEVALPFSKIEMDIDSGKYDQKSSLNCCCVPSIPDCCCCEVVHDWVEVQGPGGQILFDYTT